MASNPPSPSEDPSRCSLLGPIGLVVQGLMGCFVLSSLIIKRQLEKSRRPWRIWLWDVAKQLAGQAVIHGLNLLISDQLALVAHNNPCSLYFLNILIDTTIGVGIFYFALKGWTWVFANHFQLEGFLSGQYGHPPRRSYWWKQLAPYLLSIIVMKLLVLLPLTLPRISDALLGFSHALLESLSPSVQIVFVMALFPLVMNILQFCVVDQVIKASSVNDNEDEYRRVSTGDDDPTSPVRAHRELGTKVSTSSSRHRKSPVLPYRPSESPGLPDYGSTGTSPSPSVSDQTWVRMAKRRSTSDSSDTEQDALGVPRGIRSGAPSPDSQIGQMYLASHGKSIDERISENRRIGTCEQDDRERSGGSRGPTGEVP